MKKAQVESQAFIYLFALVSISLFMIYAFKFVLAYQHNIYTTEMLTFMQDFNSEVTNLAGQFKSTEVYEVKNAPNDYTQICFLNLKKCDASVSIRDYPIISDSCKNQIKQNVFLIKNGITQFAFYSKDMTLPRGKIYQCVNMTSGRFKVKLTGNGDSATLEPIS